MDDAESDRVMRIIRARCGDVLTGADRPARPPGQRVGPAERGHGGHPRGPQRP